MGNKESTANNNSDNNNSNGPTGEKRGSRNDGATQKKKTPKKNFIVQIQEGYAALCNAIIRPPRAEYAVRELGPKLFQISGSRFQRTDFELVNPRGFTLQCSHWEPLPPTDKKSNNVQKLPCVVYMHGNSSCRVEAIEYVETILSIGATVLAFDFSGCGLSEGPYISLGWYEQEDVQTIITWLRNSGKVSTIGLWGRSMGASTALMFGHRDPSIAAMILDSPFSDLSVLCRELAGKINIPVPGFLVGGVLGLMRSTIKSKANFDIYNCKPIQNVDKCFIPAIFTAGEEDDFILPSHSQDLHDKYAGDKNFVLVSGDHNSQRPSFFKDSVAIFLYARLCEPVGIKSNINNMHKRSIEHQQQHEVARATSGRLMPHYNIPANRATDIVGDYHDTGGAVDQDLQKALMMSLSNGTNANNGDNTNNCEDSKNTGKDQKQSKDNEEMLVNYLVAMGFNDVESRLALKRNENNVNRAAEELLTISKKATTAVPPKVKKNGDNSENANITPKKFERNEDDAQTDGTDIRTPGNIGEGK
jgi:hypothetical protein